MKLGLIFLMLISLISTSFAKHGGAVGKPKGNPHSNFGVTSTGAMPPGLENKGMPPGLERKGMTPRGWSHGKAYWKKNTDKKLHRTHKISRNQ